MTGSYKRRTVRFRKSQHFCEGFMCSLSAQNGQARMVHLVIFVSQEPELYELVTS